MRLPDPQQRGFALPLALTTSALLLLSSLSLQTLALHARQRSSQALATAQTRDAERSVAMTFQQHAVGAHACLLALPSSEWELSERCPGVNPGLLQSGRSRSQLAAAGLATPRHASCNPAVALE